MLMTSTRVSVAAAAICASSALAGPSDERHTLCLDDIATPEAHAVDQQQIVLYAGIFSPIIVVSLPEMTIEPSHESNTELTAASDLADTVERVNSMGVIIAPEPFKADLDPAQLGESGTPIQSYRRGDQLSSR